MTPAVTSPLPVALIMNLQWNGRKWDQLIERMCEGIAEKRVCL